MKKKQKYLARHQLDETLKDYKKFSELALPRKGWIRAIRNALGMTGEQLGKRLKVNQQRIARIEQDEKLGKVTISTMRKTAEALDCDFLYAFVPKTSLENTVRKQAGKVAAKQMSRSNQLMRLEKQELSDREKEKALNALTEEIINAMPKHLWDE